MNCPPSEAIPIILGGTAFLIAAGVVFLEVGNSLFYHIMDRNVAALLAVIGNGIVFAILSVPIGFLIWRAHRLPEPLFNQQHKTIMAVIGLFMAPGIYGFTAFIGHLLIVKVPKEGSMIRGGVQDVVAAGSSGCAFVIGTLVFLFCLWCCVEECFPGRQVEGELLPDGAQGGRLVNDPQEEIELLPQIEQDRAPDGDSIHLLQAQQTELPQEPEEGWWDWGMNGIYAWFEWVV